MSVDNNSVGLRTPGSYTPTTGAATKAKSTQGTGRGLPWRVSIYPSPALLVLGKLAVTLVKVASQKIQQRSAQISQAISHFHHKASGNLDKNLKGLTDLGLTVDQARQQEKRLIQQAGGDQGLVERMIGDLGTMKRDFTTDLSSYGFGGDYAGKMFCQHVNDTGIPFGSLPESLSKRVTQFNKTSNSLHKALGELAAQHSQDSQAKSKILSPETHRQALMASEGYAFNVPSAIDQQKQRLGL